MTDLQSSTHHKLSTGWIAAFLTFVGAGVIYLWQPVMDYFVTGTYDENIILKLETDSFALKDHLNLLAIRVKADNRGSVPVRLPNPPGEGVLSIEVRRIKDPIPGVWLDFGQLPLVTKTQALKQATPNPISVATNAIYEEVQTIVLPDGDYWIKVFLSTSSNPSLTQSSVLHLGAAHNKE